MLESEIRFDTQLIFTGASTTRFIEGKLCARQDSNLRPYAPHRHIELIYWFVEWKPRFIVGFFVLVEKSI